MERAGNVQTTFENLAEHASDLLRRTPDGAGIRLADDAAKVSGMYLWIMALLDIAGLPIGDSTRVQGWFPRFVPMNYLGAETLDVHPDLRVLRRNPFCESVAVIDWLTRKVITTRYSVSEFRLQHPALVRMQERDAWCFDQKRDGITLDKIVANLAQAAPDRKWRKLTRGGVRKAIGRHAALIGTPLPKGQGGRPRKTVK
jgi:hypothetical protein